MPRPLCRHDTSFVQMIYHSLESVPISALRCDNLDCLPWATGKCLIESRDDQGDGRSDLRCDRQDTSILLALGLETPTERSLDIIQRIWCSTLSQATPRVLGDCRRLPLQRRVEG